MTEFKTPLLAIALMVVTAGNLSSAAKSTTDQCIKIIENHYGNGGTHSGVENFQHSFFKKTRQIINDMFKEENSDEDETMVGQTGICTSRISQEENYDKYEEEYYDEYEPMVSQSEEENYDEYEEENYYEDEPMVGQSEEEYYDEYEEEHSDEDEEDYSDDDEENKKKLRLALVMGYFKYLYDHKEIEPHNVLSRPIWCHNQAPLVITHIQMDKIDIKEVDFTKEKQEQICLRYVKYLDIYNDLGQETFENELQKFYFETTEDSVTAAKMYPKTVDVEYETKDNIMFYLKTYAVAYYEQYKNLVINLVDPCNLMFRSVDNFCNFDGIDIMWDHDIIEAEEIEGSDESEESKE